MVNTTVTRRPMGKKIRERQRLAHLISGAVLIAYVYLPIDAGSLFEVAVRWVVLPLLVIDGLLMWQWPKLRRLARRVGGGKGVRA